MCAVLAGIHGESVGCEVVSEAVVSFLFGVFPHVVGKILMLEVHPLIYNSYNNIGTAGLVVAPNRIDINIATADG